MASVTWSVTLDTSSLDAESPYTSARWLAMSPVVRPLAYREMTASLNPPSRRTCLGRTAGSKLPARSRGTSIRTCPMSVRTVFGVVPFRALPPGRGSPWS